MQPICIGWVNKYLKIHNLMLKQVSNKWLNMPGAVEKQRTGTNILGAVLFFIGFRKD